MMKKQRGRTPYRERDRQKDRETDKQRKRERQRERENQYGAKIWSYPVLYIPCKITKMS